MRFALKAAQAESLFISAFYPSSGDVYWTNRKIDACSYSSLEHAKNVAALLGKQVEIITVTH